MVVPEYTATSHLTLTVMGFILFAVIIFTVRAELAFLKQSRQMRGQFVLSILSIAIMTYLTLVLLFHWSISPFTVFVTVMLLVPLLLILAPIILYLRARSFKVLMIERREDQKKLIHEVQEMLDDKKRGKIVQGKLERGEPLD